MNYAMLDTYMNLFLLVVVLGGAAYGLYRFSRPKTPPPREVHKRPEGHRPRAMQEETENELDEQVFEAPRPSMRSTIVKAPELRPQAPKLSRTTKGK